MRIMQRTEGGKEDTCAGKPEVFSVGLAVRVSRWGCTMAQILQLRLDLYRMKSQKRFAVYLLVSGMLPSKPHIMSHHLECHHPPNQAKVPVTSSLGWR